MIDLGLGNTLVLTDPLDCAIQSLDLMFNTTNTELIGNVNYGTKFESFLWTTYPSEDALRDYVDAKIKECGFYTVIPYDLLVKYIDLPTTDPYYIIQITLYNTSNNTKTTKEYTFN